MASIFSGCFLIPNRFRVMSFRPNGNFSICGSWLPFYVSWMLFTLGLLADGTCSGSDLQTILTVLDAKSGSEQSYRYDVSHAYYKGVPMYKLKSDNPIKAAREKGEKSFKVQEIPRESGSVTWHKDAFGEPMMKLESESWSYMEGKPHGVLEAYAFNGKTATASSTPLQGNVEGLALAEIQKDGGGSNLRQSLASKLGIRFAPGNAPLLYGTLGIKGASCTWSEFTRKLREHEMSCSASLTEAQMLRLDVPCLNDKDQQIGRTVYTFDPEKNYALTLVERFLNPEWPAVEEARIEVVEWSGGDFGPASAAHIRFDSGSMEKLEFSKVSAIPEDNMPDVFALTLGEGATIIDHETGLSYTAVDGPNSESQSVFKYVQENKLALKKAEESARRTKLMIVAGVVVFALIFLVWQRNRKGITSLVLFVSLGIGGCSKHVDSTDIDFGEEKFHWNDGWRLVSSSDSQPRVSQCGFNCVSMTLHLLRQPFDAALVSKHLRPTSLGIRMSDIKQALESHNISVQAKKNLDLLRAGQRLRDGEVAICYIPSYRKSAKSPAHYIVMMRDESDRLLYLDHPRRPIELNQGRDEELAKLEDLVVLYCSLNHEPTPNFTISPSVVRVEPMDFIAGECTGEIKLENNSGRALALYSVMASCTCTTVDFEPSIIPSGSAVQLPYSISAKGWGTGDLARAIRLLDHTSSSLGIVNVSGRSTAPIDGDSPSGSSRFTSTVQLPLVCNAPFVKELTYPINDAERLAAHKTKVTSSQSWAKGSIENADGSASFVIKLNIPENVILELSLGRPLLCTSGIYVDENSVPYLEIDYTLVRTLELQDKVTGVNNGLVETTISVLSEVESARIELLEIEPAAKTQTIHMMEQISDLSWKFTWSDTRERVFPLIANFNFGIEGSHRISCPLVVNPHVGSGKEDN